MTPARALLNDGPKARTALDGVRGRVTDGPPIVSAALALQRAAGNRAAAAVLAPTSARLARCGAGGCSCGGACKRDEVLEDERGLGVLRHFA